MEGNLLILRNWDDYYFLLKDPCGNHAYSFLLNMHQESLKEGYRKLSTLKIPLTIALEISEPVIEKQLQSILSFLFLPYYQTPRIYLFLDDDALFTNTSSSLINYFKDQNIDINLIRIRQDAEYFRDLKSSDKSFIVCDSLNEVQAFEKISNENSPVKNEVGSLRIKNMEQQQQIKLLTAELEIQKTYNEKLRNSHQAKEIQSYYDNQYEILPGWYKKIGNFIKRLMKKN